ncbi:uncharacterized protein LOC108676743 [Hyalella azteca]|uniref:Uncharacterized protein LOC108676743 n=1 Tax=Hyalella azteca TaxID=294128 RepID=A0A8B7P2M8_HYAAZ|nr:uncharacterized protein LOC108676743 [Hyalella azteca]
MAPGDCINMFGSSLPNFVSTKKQIPPCCGTGSDSCRGCVMFYPSVKLKGLFMHDNVFEEVRQLSELQEIKARRDDQSPVQRQLELRRDDVVEEISEVIEQFDRFYIILPTHGYATEDIRIKAVGDRDIVVESRPHYSKNDEEEEVLHMLFTLPVALRLDAVTPLLSSDKILVITAPKLHPK